MFVYPPYFHLTIMGGVDVQGDMFGVNGAESDLLDQASMAAIEIFCQAQEDAQHPYDLLRARVEGSEFRVFLARQGLALVQCRGRHDGNFLLVKAQQIGITDEIIRVRLVVSIRQECPDVVQQRRVLQQFTFSRSQTV